MKRRVSILLAIAAFLIPFTAIAIPQVAVLDAVVPDDMDDSVIIPITDKICEELVNSGKYMVLDRAAVEQVLREKEFQLSSGLVRTEEIRKAGEYLGADYVVAARASKVGSTFFLSARMIDVKTGAITAQTSVEQQGTIDVLLQIAKAAGARLAGGVVEKVAEEKFTAAKPGPKPLPEEKPKPAARPEPVAREAPPLLLGIKAGISSATVYGEENWTDQYTGLRYLVGGYFTLPLGRILSLEADALFIQKGYDLDFYDDIALDDVYNKWVYNYLDIPVIARLVIHRRTGFYVGAGAFASLFLGGNVTIDYSFQDVYDDEMDISDTSQTPNESDFGAIVTLGFDYPIRNYILNLEMRYTVSLEGYLDDPLLVPKHSVLSVIAGLGLAI
jgi:TolB-like protein